MHRDLKPSNVLIAEDGPRVIDFGISRAVESTPLTQAGLVIGSPGFMSPEQAAGYEVGPPTDIFSLGAVLAFAATGEGPFGTGTTAALLYRVVHGDPSLDRVPSEVRPLIERCLAKDPGQRPTADGLLAEVGALQPTPHWLPESIIRAFSPIPRQVPRPPQPPRRPRPLRRPGRWPRPGRWRRSASPARRRHRPRRPAPRRSYPAGKACCWPPQAIRRPPPPGACRLPGIPILPGARIVSPRPVSPRQAPRPVSPRQAGAAGRSAACGGRWCWCGSSPA